MGNVKNGILAALAANQDCEIRDPLREKRVLMTERGVMSYHNDQELVAFIADWPESMWFGHVLRLDPDEISDSFHGKGEWVAVIVQAYIYPAGNTEQAVFEAMKDALQLRNRYEPCYCLNPEDTLRLCNTFEKACAALAEMIDHFDAVLMGDYALDDRDYIPPEFLGAQLDMRVMDIYGLSCPDHVREVDIEILGRRCLQRAKGEGWIDEVRRLIALDADSEGSE